jgi:hypothetical protein
VCNLHKLRFVTKTLFGVVSDFSQTGVLFIDEAVFCGII